MWWELKPDEAIVVEFEDPRTFWMLGTEGVFGNSMDFLYRPVSYTPSRTAIDADGKIRLVLAARDPGYWNWIDNQAYAAGMLTFRNVQATGLPDFTTTVMKGSQVARAMHPSSRTITAEERRRQLLRRYHATLRRYRI